MSAYPVQLEATAPLHYDRSQLLVRLALAITLGWIGISTGWLSVLLYLTLPIFAAIVISTQSPEALLSSAGPRLWRVIDWLLAFSAYMLLVTDRFPSGRDHGVLVELHPTARPTVESALLRLVTSIPSAFVLAILCFVSSLLVLVSVLTVLFACSVPAAIVAFQTGILRWQSRLIAYHASLVDEYPPFSLDTSRRVTDAHAGAM